MVAPMLIVVVNAPENVTSEPTVMCLPVFATPVPPYWPATTEEFQMPVVIVPTDTRDDRVVTEVVAKLVAHPKPVPLVQISPSPEAEQDGTARPLGVVAVSAPRTVLAVCVASCAFVIDPLSCDVGRLRTDRVVSVAFDVPVMFAAVPVVVLVQGRNPGGRQRPRRDVARVGCVGRCRGRKPRHLSCGQRQTTQRDHS